MTMFCPFKFERMHCFVVSSSQYSRTPLPRVLPLMFPKGSQCRPGKHVVKYCVEDYMGNPEQEDSFCMNSPLCVDYMHKPSYYFQPLSALLTCAF